MKREHGDGRTLKRTRTRPIQAALNNALLTPREYQSRTKSNINKMMGRTPKRPSSVRVFLHARSCAVRRKHQSFPRHRSLLTHDSLPISTTHHQQDQLGGCLKGATGIVLGEKEKWPTNSVPTAAHLDLLIL